MNTKLYNFYSFLCIFPLWIFRSNLDLSDIVFSFLLFGFLPIIINYAIIKYNSKNFNLFFILWLSCISFYSVDQNIGLWSLKNNFFLTSLTSPYIVGLFNSILLIIVFFVIIKIMRVNGVKILFSFLLVLFIFNIFDKSKYYSNFPKKYYQKIKQFLIKNIQKKLL